MNQRSFAATNYCFAWTADGWYEWDSEKAHKEAQAERNREAAAVVKEGRKVKKWSNRGCLMSKGGIGSGKPHIELVCTVYGFNIID